MLGAWNYFEKAETQEKLKRLPQEHFGRLGIGVSAHVHDGLSASANADVFKGEAMRNFGKVLGLAVLVAVVAGRGTAQEAAASLRGTVADGGGGIVAGADVAATQKETGLQRLAKSDTQGAYVLVALPVGHYRLEVRLRDSRPTCRTEFPWT